MHDGYLSLVLHAHLPYVRHPEYPHFLEEDWLYEAITETYLPLLWMLEEQARDGVPARFAMSLTPPLCHMLRDPLLQARYRKHLDNLLALTEKEIVRTEGDSRLHPIVSLYFDRFTRAKASYEACQGDLVGRFAAFQEEGRIEIITCAATHGFLPLLNQHPQAVRAQIMIARDDYRACFGRDPVGIWLPECAYVSGLDSILQEANLRWFILDSHGLMFGNPRPRYAIYAPGFTPSGPAVFARDRESSRQVWSAEEGYPGDAAYRDFYRDIGFDLGMKYLAPHLPGGQRKFTGLKYHRITGRNAPKDIYNRAWAEAAVDAHAADFMWSRARQIGDLRKAMDRPPLVLSPFDAELFGHWWFEGPEFLDLFLRKSAYDQNVFRLITPGEYLRGNPTQQILSPSASSWGNMGYWEVWLDESNSWIYPHLHQAGRRMSELARHHADNASPETDRVLRQLARELLLAQSSDWAFLMKTGTARPYAEKRTRDHLLRFHHLQGQFEKGAVDAAFLENCEWRDNIFPELNWHHFI